VSHQQVSKLLPIAATPSPAMAEISEKKPAGAPSDQPSFTKHEASTDEADMALAAMGYQPVSQVAFGPGLVPGPSSSPAP
jgi:hypothetical protein